jgi:hypothetical protein
LESLTIDASALYALAKPSVPQEVRDEAIEKAAEGEMPRRPASKVPI